MTCSDVSEKLGTYLDGELSGHEMETVRAHLEQCERCRTRLEALQAMVRPLRASSAVQAPPGLWDAIEARLVADERTAVPLSAARAEQEPVDRRSVGSSGGRRLTLWRPRSFLVAAAVLLPIGLVAMFLQLASPRAAWAEEAVIDFDPLLARIETDFEGAMADFLKRHSARPIERAEAGRYLELRVHARAPVPDGLVLNQMHLLALGKKHGLLFQFDGPKGKLVVSQCPEDVKHEHGGRPCLPCRIGSRFKGEVVHAGPWNLVHMPSKQGCICILSTLDDAHLANVLEALQIEF